MMTVGLFGGTFDPVHVGHERMVRAALAMGLQRVIVMPCCLSPHKIDAASHERPADGEHRRRMLELALGAVTGVEISTYELARGGVSFTWQTLEFLRKKFTGARLALLVGLDQYHKFPRWQRFAEWGRGLDIYVFGRAGQAPLTVGAAHAGPVYHWPTERIPAVSASAIRQRARAGQSLTGLVSPPVAEYIRSRRLYLA
ncbi:MAG: nicotinate (nicotinamide) nucleotide adenylyltransferase [Verrucomicrobiales bacterium]|jgi:nicotinate-nucleotide adenylyltransferase|nr:nicotinate (nicotinamide) nucleotide adenylyltransferase [Verrucomicrobiales bacterium]